MNRSDDNYQRKYQSWVDEKAIAHYLPVDLGLFSQGYKFVKISYDYFKIFQWGIRIKWLLNRLKSSVNPQTSFS
jgi:hypothetical protein